MPQAELWSLVASGVSVALGLMAIALSLYFFVSSKNVEKATSNSLVKIENQADMLARLTSRQLDRLTRYVTQQHPTALEESSHVVELMSQYVAVQLKQFSTGEDKEKLLNELVSCYIAVYFYTGHTNFWAQGYLPVPSLYDPTNPSQAAASRVVDASYADFLHMQKIFAGIDPKRLSENFLFRLFQETEGWKSLIRPAAEVFVLRQQQAEGA